MHPITSEVYIQLLKIVLILSLVFPYNVQAQTEPILSYDQVAYQAISSENTLYRIPVEIPTPPVHASANQATGYGGNCVAYAKKVTGIGGTWGNGGRLLSLNSDGQVGDVVIFTYIHVAVVIDRVGETLTITESNYDLRGHIRTRTMSVYDPTIRGFHRF